MSRFELRRRLVAGPIPLSLAIGNFDGVHLGHQAILAAAAGAAGRHGWVPAAMSFQPLPREYFARISSNLPGIPRLMSASEKMAAFRRAGMQACYLPRFDAAFAAQSPGEFTARLAAMCVRHVVVGEDFRFGCKRAGDVDALRRAGHQHGFEVEAVADVSTDGIRVSSTAIREALAGGDLAAATRMLGARYAIVGRVGHGARLGRTLGFPTANIALTGRKPALGGVFAVQCRLVTRGLEGVASKAGTILDGVASLGTNPAVSSAGRQKLEVFLFDLPDTGADLYGRRIACEFIEKIRDEQNFASLDALVARMRDDASTARSLLQPLRTKNDGPEG